MYILDTDAITHYQAAHPVLSDKVNRTPHEQLFTTSVTVEEQFKGRLAYIQQHRDSPKKLAQGYAALVQSVAYFAHWNILPYDEAADAVFRQLRKQRLRIGSQDLRIAAIALLHDVTVVTSNVRDFRRVRKLKVEDWTTGTP